MSNQSRGSSRGIRSTGRKLRRTGRNLKLPKRGQADATQFELPSLQFLDVAHSLDHVNKIVARRIGDVARDVEATPGQLQVVAAVARAPEGLTAKQIAAALAIRPGSLTGMLDQLEVRGAIARLPVPGDARQARIVLRAEAQPLIDALERVNQQVARLLSPLGDDTLQKVADLAGQLEDQLRDDVGVPVPEVLRSTSPDGIRLPKLRDEDRATPAASTATSAPMATDPVAKVTAADEDEDDTAWQRGARVIDRIRSTVDAVRGRRN